MIGNPDNSGVIRRDQEAERAGQELYAELGREPTDAEVEEYLSNYPDPPDADAEPDDLVTT